MNVANGDARFKRRFSPEEVLGTSFNDFLSGGEVGAEKLGLPGDTTGNTPPVNLSEISDDDLQAQIRAARGGS